MMMTKMMMIQMNKIPQLPLRLKMETKRTLSMSMVKFTTMMMMTRELNRRKTMKTRKRWRKSKKKKMKRRSLTRKMRKTVMTNRKLKAPKRKLTSRPKSNRLHLPNLEYRKPPSLNRRSL